MKKIKAKTEHVVPVNIKANLTDDGLLMSPDGEDDYNIVDYIPDSYLDDSGVRHAIVWDHSVTKRYRLVGDKLEKIAEEVF